MARPANIHYGIHVLSSILLILVIGSSSCQGSDCTQESMRACSSINDNGCRFYQSELSCLELIDQSHCTDNLLLMLKSYTSVKKEKSQECPGLPDGTCYSSEVRSCDKDIPARLAGSKRFNSKDSLAVLTQGTKEMERKLCKDFEGKANGKTECYKTLLSKCTSRKLRSNITGRMNFVDKIVKFCAKYYAN